MRFNNNNLQVIGLVSLIAVASYFVHVAPMIGGAQVPNCKKTKINY